MGGASPVTHSYRTVQFMRFGACVRVNVRGGRGRANAAGTFLAVDVISQEVAGTARRIIVSNYPLFGLMGRYVRMYIEYVCI